MTGTLITTSEAAEELGVTVGRIRQLLGTAQLPGRKLGRDWVIRRADLERYKALPPATPARPREVPSRPARSR
jgi:excisionase family DNA binding protein